MFQNLKKKWKVNSIQLLLIILTFALGGSACATISKKALGLLNLSNELVELVLYIILITISWPICVLLISIPFGQFSFFKNYLKRVIGKLSGKKATFKE